MAHEACRATVEEFLKIGGEYRQMPVTAPEHLGGKPDQVKLEDGTGIASDYFIFACGPWLGKLFPDVIGDHIRPTRQEVYYFRIPAGEKRFSEGAFPVWADHPARLVYGIPAADGGGLKIADDTRGPLSIRRMATER